MAGNGRFGTLALPLDSQQFLLHNSRSGLPDGLPSGLGSSHFLPGFRRRLPKGFPSNLGSLTSSHTSEEAYPRVFLQASEVSHPSILRKKTTQGLSFKPRKSHILPYFRRRVPDGFPSSLGCSRLLPYFRRRLPKGVITPRQEAAEC